MSYRATHYTNSISANNQQFAIENKLRMQTWIKSKIKNGETHKFPILNGTYVLSKENGVENESISKVSKLPNITRVVSATKVKEQETCDLVKETKSGIKWVSKFETLPSIKPQSKPQKVNEGSALKNTGEGIPTNKPLYMPASNEHKCLIYKGLSHEQKARKAYLDVRNTVKLEDKYAFPVTSAMDYGWNLKGNNCTPVGARPKHAIKRNVSGEFFSRHYHPHNLQHKR